MNVNVDAWWSRRGPFSSPVASAMAGLSSQTLSLSSPLGYVLDHPRFHYWSCSPFPPHKKTLRHTKKILYTTNSVPEDTTRVMCESRRSNQVGEQHQIGLRNKYYTKRRLVLDLLSLSLSLCFINKREECDKDGVF